MYLLKNTIIGIYDMVSFIAGELNINLSNGLNPAYLELDFMHPKYFILYFILMNAYKLFKYKLINRE